MVNLKYPYFTKGSSWELKKADMTIFTDGASSILKIKHAGIIVDIAYYGASAFVAIKDGVMIHSDSVSGNYKTGQAELIAMGIALKWVNENHAKGFKLQIVSDATYAIDSLTEYCWRPSAVINEMANPAILRRLKSVASEFMEMGGEIFITQVKSHTGVEFNEFTDQLAVSAKEEYIEKVHPGLVESIQAKFKQK
jgi:ribonuclease HI